MAKFADTTFTASGADPETHDISWPFVDQAHVKVQRNGVLLVEDTDYRFSGASQLEWSSSYSLNTAGDTIRVFRNTSQSSRLTTYTAVRLNKTMLENDSLQAFYMGQEALDAIQAEGFELVSTDAGAGYGPIKTLYRNSTSPADNDGLGEVHFDGNDSGGNQTTVAAIRATWIDVTDTTEDGEISFRTIVAGTLADKVAIRNGIFGVGATGGDKGANTANFSGYYVDGTDLFARANTWTGQQIISTVSPSAVALSIENADASASSGPVLDMARDSASPAANDGLGVVRWVGKNDAAEDIAYTQMSSTIIDPTDGSEDGRMQWFTRINGTLQRTLRLQTGLLVGIATTGGDPTDGVVNCQGVEINGTAIPFHVSYTSPLQTITSSGLLTLAHGLGAEPKSLMFVLECQVADAGYSIGDRIFVDLNNTASGINRFNACYFDSTNVNIRFTSAGTCFTYANKTTGSAAGLINTSWKLEVRAYA